MNKLYLDVSKTKYIIIGKNDCRDLESIFNCKFLAVMTYYGRTSFKTITLNEHTECDLTKLPHMLNTMFPHLHTSTLR